MSWFPCVGSPALAFGAPRTEPAPFVLSSSGLFDALLFAFAPEGGSSGSESPGVGSIAPLSGVGFPVLEFKVESLLPLLALADGFVLLATSSGDCWDGV